MMAILHTLVTVWWAIACVTLTAATSVTLLYILLLLDEFTALPPAAEGAVRPGAVRRHRRRPRWC